MKSKLIDAFDAASDGYSADRVVADPELNARFLSECQQLAMVASAATINRSLLNLRKRGALSGRDRSKRTSFPDEDEYRFAAEMAVRFLERRDGVSLDGIICDPDLAAEFDKVASTIAPGFTALQYRWAALNLRKSKALAPEILARVVRPSHVFTTPVSKIDLNEIPLTQGLYLFFASDKLLYVGETENLRSRLKKHIDHSDNKGFARWLWELGANDLHIEVQVLADSTALRVRRALELELIRSRRPIFNVKR